MREFFQKIKNSRWFEPVTWTVIIAFSLLLLPEILLTPTKEQLREQLQESQGYPMILPDALYYAGLWITRGWFIFEMLVRFLADGDGFFRSRRNLFDLFMCALVFIPYLDWCVMLRLLRNIFTNNTGVKDRDRSGTMR